MLPTYTITGARVLDTSGAAKRNLAIRLGRITNEDEDSGPSLDLSGHLVIPGLINAHDHLQRNNVPRPDCERLFANSYEWADAIQPHLDCATVVAARAIPESIRFTQGGLKNLLCGALTVAHHDPWHPIMDDVDFPVRVVREFGWAHSPGMSGLHPGVEWRYGPAVRESCIATLPGRPWIIHAAEGVDRLAAGELALLEDLGCLRINTVLIHGIGLGEADQERIIETGAAVVWCPASNIRLYGKTLDPRRLFEAGALALGTDSRFSGSFDLLEELRDAARYSDLTARELYALVTEMPARILRSEDSGNLGIGCRADFMVLNDDGSDPFDQLLRARRTSIRAVVRNGIPRVADYDLEDWFMECGVSARHACLDGHPKLIAWSLLGPAVTIEPGLEVD